MISYFQSDTAYENLLVQKWDRDEWIEIENRQMIKQEITNSFYNIALNEIYHLLSWSS